MPYRQSKDNGGQQFMPKQIVRIDGRMAIDGTEHRLQSFPNRSIPASL
jgi:hypothetical protein